MLGFLLELFLVRITRTKTSIMYAPRGGLYRITRKYPILLIIEMLFSQVTVAFIAVDLWKILFGRLVPGGLLRQTLLHIGTLCTIKIGNFLPPIPSDDFLVHQYDAYERINLNCPSKTSHFRAHLCLYNWRRKMTKPKANQKPATGKDAILLKNKSVNTPLKSLE